MPIENELEAWIRDNAGSWISVARGSNHADLKRAIRHCREAHGAWLCGGWRIERASQEPADRGG